MAADHWEDQQYRKPDIQPVEPSGKRLDRQVERNIVRGLRLLVAGVVVVTLGVATGPSAVADRGRHHAYPTKAEVQRAQARAEQKRRDVGVIKARLLMAGQRVEQAQLRAEQASEAYNGAMWRLDQAKQKLAQARGDAAKARRTVAEQRDRIGALVAASYQQGDQLSALSAMMSAKGPEGVLDQYAAFQGASSSVQADYQRFAAADALAKVFERKAAQAKVEQVRLAAKARSARDAAAGAAQQAEAEAAAVAAEKSRLIRELASAQGVSVRLAQQRQTALAEIARKRAEEQARRAALAAARAKARAEARARAAAARQAAQRRNLSESGSANPPPPAPTPPVQDPAPAPGRVGAAISFARAQLGEPYLWGGAGPDAWDCSGLTQGAWAAAGVYLPHFAAAQYDQGTPVPVSDARPGDLLFWSSNGSPSGIHHVALYVGGGEFIEAPHTGANVRYDSIYAWYPDFAVRL